MKGGTTDGESACAKVKSGPVLQHVLGQEEEGGGNSDNSSKDS